MDIEKLIEQLNRYFEGKELKRGTALETATALSTLQAENERLRDELEQVKRALAMMWFAYVNKDEELPHSFELEALEKAEHILGPWEKCMLKYLKRGPKEE